MKSLLKQCLIVLPFLVGNELYAQCSPRFTTDPDACPLSSFSARLEYSDPPRINPDPQRIVANASDVQPNTSYNLVVFHDSFPNENVIACVGNSTGFTVNGAQPFCPSCNDLSSFTIFRITTNSNYTPSIGIAFDLYPACSQNKSCGTTYCGSPYELEIAPRDLVTIRIF